MESLGSVRSRSAAMRGCRLLHPAVGESEGSRDRPCAVHLQLDQEPTDARVTISDFQGDERRQRPCVRRRRQILDELVERG